MNKTNPAALAALPEGCVLSLRTHSRNPNHHLRWHSRVCETGCCATNGYGTWWLHATVHRADFTKQGLRVPLETKNIHKSRSQGDAVLASLSGQRKEAA